MDLLDRMRKMQVDEEEVRSLVAKCQENGWLRYGGYAWQDDPWLEEYPYAFGKRRLPSDIFVADAMSCGRLSESAAI